MPEYEAAESKLGEPWSTRPRTRSKKRLTPGQRLARTREKNRNLDPEAAYESAREYVLYLLDRRAYSSAEIRTKLAHRGYQSEVIDQLVARFQEVNLLNDELYAQQVVQAAFAQRGLVGAALRQELGRKGIPADLVNECIAQVSSEQTADKARELAEKKLLSSLHLGREKALRRAAAQLARKGYSAGIAWQTVKEVWEQCQTAEEAESD